MSQLDPSTEQHNASGAENKSRKPYVKPSVRRLGSVRELTKTGTGK
jgi:hypothetical protein